MTDRRLKSTTRTCAHCGEEFEATQEHRNFKRKYCSFTCTGAANRARAEAKYPPKEEIEFLYRECGMSDLDVGKRYGHSYQWAFNVRRRYGIPGEKHTRAKPLHRKNHRGRWNMRLKPEEACRNCGIEGQILHAHHAVPRSLAPAGKFDLRNLLPLCASCHQRWHAGRPIPRAIFTAEEWEFISTLIGSPWLDKRYPAEWASELAAFQDEAA